MQTRSKIYVAGAHTLIGAGILRALQEQGYPHVLGDGDLDLTSASDTDAFFARERPEYVFLAAGRSAGIEGNRRYPVDLMHHNLLVDEHVMRSAYRHEVRKLVYFASSCIYPKHCRQPMSEDDLHTGPLEPTSEAYATAKIAGIALCRAYRRQYEANFVSAIPADVFGPGDDFTNENSHVVAALVRRMHDAKEHGLETIDIWGTGEARREFLFVDDLAGASILVMREYEGADPINLGSGEDFSVRELATLLKEVVGYRGRLRFDHAKPEGMPRKLLDSSKLRTMGWRPRTSLRDALLDTYDWFLKNHRSGSSIAQPNEGEIGQHEEK